jgi:hypothetical protein
MSWEQEIIQKNTERLLSLAFQVSNTNEFEKAIVDDLSYSEDFRIEKTGKEVKEKLQVELSTIATEKITFISKMESLVKEIGCLPSGKPDQWQIRGFEKYLGEVPRQYPYEQIYPNKKSEGCYPDSGSELPSYGITPVDSKMIVDKMREYNQIASNYICRCIDAIKLKTVIDNLPDTKKIKLAPQLASQLGF